MKMLEKVIPASEKVYKPSSPFQAKILETRRLTPQSSRDEIRHIVLDLAGSGITYLEGQCIGVVTPGTDEKGKPHRLRLYSIASARSGDDGLASTVSLCVKRVVITDPGTGKEIRGVASNYICDRKEGDIISMTGPTGRKLLLPDDDTIDLLLVAVGTGIAPFRSYIEYIYREYGRWRGRVRLFYGSKSGLESLYMNDENNDIGQYFTRETFEAYRALSEVERNARGGQVLVHDRIEERLEDVWAIIRNGHFAFYICGVKGLEAGIDEILTKRAARDGLDWAVMKAAFDDEGRWNTELY